MVEMAEEKTDFIYFIYSFLPFTLFRWAKLKIKKKATRKKKKRRKHRQTIQ